MKSINLPPLHFISSPLTIVKSESNSREQSPYLRAILSGKSSTLKQEETLKADNPDRAAASRYIRDSRMLRKK